MEHWPEEERKESVIKTNNLAVLPGPILWPGVTTADTIYKDRPASRLMDWTARGFVIKDILPKRKNLDSFAKHK